MGILPYHLKTQERALKRKIDGSGKACTAVTRPPSPVFSRRHGNKLSVRHWGMRYPARRSAGHHTERRSVMSSCTQKSKTPGPTGEVLPDRHCVTVGDGPRLAADGRILSVSSGGRYAPTPSLNESYQPPTATVRALAGNSNALPRIFAFCEIE